jgi:uncharacterized protein YhaN
MTTGNEDRDARLDEALARLPRAVEPARDLWPDIEARLEPREARSARRWLWPAAAAVLLAVGSSLVTARLMQRETPQVAQQPRPSPAITFAAAEFGPGQTLGPHYDAARAELARSLAQRIERLPPDARRQLEKNLAELQRASAEINAALELSPGDPLLEELLFNAYQDELAVLANVNQLAGGNGPGAAHDPTRMQL